MHNFYLVSIFQIIFSLPVYCEKKKYNIYQKTLITISDCAFISGLLKAE